MGYEWRRDQERIGVGFLDFSVSLSLKKMHGGDESKPARVFPTYPTPSLVLVLP